MSKKFEKKDYKMIGLACIFWLIINILCARYQENDLIGIYTMNLLNQLFGLLSGYLCLYTAYWFSNLSD